MLNRTEIIELLRESARISQGYARDSVVGDYLRELRLGWAAVYEHAADLREAGGSRVQYRVVDDVEFIDGKEWLRGASPSLTLDGAERLLASRKERGRTSRIQRSEVTRTPWVGVEDGS